MIAISNLPHQISIACQIIWIGAFVVKVAIPIPFRPKPWLLLRSKIIYNMNLRKLPYYLQLLQSYKKFPKPRPASSKNGKQTPKIRINWILRLWGKRDPKIQVLNSNNLMKNRKTRSMLLNNNKVRKRKGEWRDLLRIISKSSISSRLNRGKMWSSKVY